MPRGHAALDSGSEAGMTLLFKSLLFKNSRSCYARSLINDLSERPKIGAWIATGLKALAMT